MTGLLLGILIIIVPIGIVTIPEIVYENYICWIRKYKELIDSQAWLNPYDGDFIRFKNMPQLTLKRFLTLYAANPENWMIEGQNNNSSLAPYYCTISKESKKIVIPIFWTNYKEMKKFIKWRNNQWRRGKEAKSEKIRDKNLLTLTESISDDLQKERNDFIKKLEEKNSEITLTLTKKD